LAFFASHCLAGGTYFPIPSHSQIKDWWKPENRESPDEELDIIDVNRILLKSGEQAFMASVRFPTRGRCCGAGILLIRPAVKEARQVDPLLIDVNAHVFKVIYLSDARISGVAISG
jgi:hypothetical protein